MGSTQNVINFIAVHRIKIRQKGDWEKNWHLIVPFFFYLVGIFNKEKKEDFYKKYFTALGKTIYVPDLLVFIENLAHYEPVIYHEHQHMIDMPGWYGRIMYVVSKRKRLWYETRGYFWNVHFELQKYGRVDKAVVDNIIAQLSGEMYNHMTDKGNATKIVHNMVLDAKRHNFPK